LTGAIVIPEKVTYNGTDYAVTTFADDAFANCSAITSISIPSSVTSVGFFCFGGCKALVSINVDEANTKILF
jgi:hypothetical protein